jgi:hypothetical protein
MQFGSTSRGKEGADAGGGWLSSVTLASLAELNELALALLAEQAAARSSCGKPLLQMMAQLWHTLDASAQRRAACCPYLLVDAGFADGLRWQSAALPQVGDSGDRAYAAFFSTPNAPAVARLVFTYAWHLVRSQGRAAQLLLGVSATSAAVIGRHTLPQIQALAESHAGWLTPRWPTRLTVWRELLLAAASGEPAALQRVQLRGLTLMAGEARLAAQRTARSPGRPSRVTPAD